MARADTYTRWGIVAAGEGGGRIAAEFFARSDNPGIDDRIVLLNTNRADIRNTIEQANIEDSLDEYTTVFGSKRGVGNSFLAGEECAREGLDDIARQIDDRAPDADAFLHTTTLGGGTGNGTIPYLMRQFDAGSEMETRRPWMDSAVHIALAAWPYYDEPAHRQFNAICGLSRLLRRRDGEQNADMVLLAANSHLDESGAADSYDAVNRRILSAIDLLISAGREAHGVVDVEDYVAKPSEIGAYHFTPAVGEGLNAKMLEFELLFDRAAENAFVPMDVGTSRAAYAIVRAPERLIDSGEVTTNDVKSAFNDWKRKHGLGAAVGMSTLAPKDDRSNDVDVLLLLGGFDLNPLLEHARGRFEEHKENLETARQLGTQAESAVSEAYLADLEDNLQTYVDLNAR
ncbi:MAG: hypothetical protein ABEJ79_06490 [Halolamina sp.]